MRNMRERLRFNEAQRGQIKTLISTQIETENLTNDCLMMVQSNSLNLCCIKERSIE